MIDYLKTLQIEYKKYNEMEVELRTFLEKCCGLDRIIRIIIEDDAVEVYTFKIGCDHHDDEDVVYLIPFEHFRDPASLRQNILKYRLKE